MEYSNISPLDIELDDYIPEEICRLADDEFSCVDDEVFFYGKIVNSDDWRGCKSIDESKHYSVCPSCGKLFQHKKKPKNGENVTCTHCSYSGTAFDFRDPTIAIDTPMSFLAYLEYIDGGFVLRLFNSWLDYSEREFNNYKMLSCYPDVATKEVAREYWFNGEYYYYTNVNQDPNNDPEFVEVEASDICDEDYWIYNYDNIYDPESSALTDDIKYSDPYKSETCIEALIRRIPYRAFRTLQKYGFTALAKDSVYVPGYFPDSSKICEVLMYDYNKLKANFEIEEIGIAYLEYIRALDKYGIVATEENADIIARLDSNADKILSLDKPKKIFKYLRNQARKIGGASARDYADYICECEKLGYDIKEPSVLYPTDLATAHRRTSALVKIENSALVEQAIKDKYEQLHTACEWSNDKYAIVMPKCADEIITEGAILNHCVGNYCERVANGESIILFLRKIEKLDKPFFTVEIRPNMKKLDFVQCRGYKNADPSKEIYDSVDDFLESYKKWFNKRKFEQVTNTTRTYYKAIKKTVDGRYISAWDNSTEYRIGEITESQLCDNPDRVAVQGIHFASLEFAQKYGDAWENVAILELEVNIHDMVIPDAKDQLRASKVKVIREVPMSELGKWGERHLKKSELIEAVA